MGSVITLAVLLALAGGAGEVQSAGSVFYSTRSVLEVFFPDSERVGFERYRPPESTRRAIAREIGEPLGTDELIFYVARTGERVDGYAVIDTAMGRSLPFKFGLKISPAGAVQRIEIMEYRSPFGDEVRRPAFLDQFKGRTTKDPLRVGRDIDAISGATINARSLAASVRRLLIVFEHAYPNRERDNHAATERKSEGVIKGADDEPKHQ